MSTKFINRRGLKKFGLRRCLLCKNIFDLNEENFYHIYSDKSASGFDWYCKECHREKNRKYYRSFGLKSRFEFMKKFNFTCQYCGRKAPEVVFHVDHIYPVSKGGDDNVKNLTLACDECNLGKGSIII